MNLSSLKSIIYGFIIESILFYLIINNIDGIELSGEPVHIIMLFVAFYLSTILVPQFIRFFVLPNNMLFSWFIRIFTNAIGIYLMINLLPGISIHSMEIGPFYYNSLTIDTQTLQPIATIGLTALLTSTFGTIMGWLSSD